MKICFIVDYLPKPFSEALFSGAEVSISLLFNALNSYGYKVEYACYSDWFQANPRKNLPDSFWLNPVIIIIGAIRLAKQVFQMRPDIIHVHGKNSVYSAFLANLFFHLPMVITVRDYKLLCNLGVCLLGGENVCTSHKYLESDIPEYLIRYAGKSRLTKAKLILFSPIEIFRRKIANKILSSLNKVICLSHAQEKIYKNSGLKNTTVIYNLAEIGKEFGKKSAKDKIIVYTGRYSPGKGEDLLNYTIEGLLNKYPDWTLGIIGNFDSSKITQKNVVYYGQVPLDRYRHLVGKASFAVVPSVWPEPFGRAALDAISAGTPAVVTERGGLPEIIDNGDTGIITKPSPKAFYNGVEAAIKKASILQKNIFSSKEKLIEKFYEKPIKMHLNLYNRIKK